MNRAVVAAAFAAILAAVILRLRNRRYREIAAQERVDIDADGIPDVYEAPEDVGPARPAWPTVDDAADHDPDRGDTTPPGRPAKPFKDGSGRRQRLLAQSQFSKLRGLCTERDISRSAEHIDRFRSTNCLRRHVRGSGVVALPSSDRRRKRS